MPDDMAVLNYPSWSISAEFVAYLAFPVLVPLVLLLVPLVMLLLVLLLVLRSSLLVRRSWWQS